MDKPHSDDNRWFTEEVQPLEPGLRSYLRYRFPGVDEMDDVVQESFVRVLKARAKGPIRSAKDFLFAVARNTVRDVIRRRTAAHLVPLTELHELSVAEDAPGIREQVSRRQELAFLADAIQALPVRCQQVFLLRKIQGLSQKEIAAQLGISENTVESLVAKGARRCASYLRDRGLGGSPHVS